MKPNIITISGPSAAGKSFLVDKIIDEFPNITEIIGLTTRPKRDGEIDGKSSFFMTTVELEQLEEAGELMLVKEFFGNKYAWYKRDLVNTQGLRIVNISYKSIKELKEKGLNIFSIFIRPESEEKIKEMLKLRIISKSEYEKRLKDYYESEQFLKKSRKDFDMVFKNCYDEKSSNDLLGFVEKTFIQEKKNNVDLEINKKIESLLLEDTKLEHNIKLATELLLEYKQHDKEGKEYDR